MEQEMRTSMNKLVTLTMNIPTSEYDLLCELGDPQILVSQAVEAFLRKGQRPMISHESCFPYTLKRLSFSLPADLAEKVKWDRDDILNDAVSFYLARHPKPVRVENGKQIFQVETVTQTFQRG
jgi:hypothetical protein